MKTLILMSGPPCCGKSTWVENYLKLKDPNASVHLISSDELIDLLAGEYGCSYSELWQEAIKASSHVVKLKTKLALKLVDPCTVIIDSTNVNEKLRWEKVEKFKEAGFRLHLVYFVKPQDDNYARKELRRRNMSRSRSPLDTSLIMSYYGNYQQPTEAELQKWDQHESFTI